MNKVHLFVLPLALLLAAYSGQSVAADIECTIDESPMPPCMGDPRVPMVNLNLKKMKASPLCVRAHPGTTLVFSLTPKKGLELETIEISPKDDEDDADDWLAGDNDTYEELIVIRIPEKLAPGNYNYDFKTPDKCVDPRVHVEN